MAIEGFEWGAADVGGRGRPNLGVLVASRPETVGAAVYTTSDVVAAPVIVSREYGAVPTKRAVIINAGHANAYTGADGIEDARATCRALGQRLGVPAEEVFVASTGVIGARPPIRAMEDALPELLKGLRRDGLADFARAIMTTDTHPKMHESRAHVAGQTVSFAGCSKGAGMIMPNMATMLGVVVCDANIDAPTLQHALRLANDKSFNCITVDGDTSTNDTVFALANGASGGPRIEQGTAAFDSFVDAMTAHAVTLAQAIVRDGEGATKFIEVHVRGATSDQAARTVALSVANSPLVKTAFHGEDLNFGRIAMAIGKARTGMDPNRVRITVDEHVVAANGAIAQGDALVEAAASLKNRDIQLSIDFSQGSGAATVWTCDLSAEYIRINADYTT